MKQLTYLRVKVKSLAEEATIIRKEERTVLKRRDWHMVRQGPNDIVDHFYGIYVRLHTHRVHDVRNEARSSQLAYAFLRGKTYAETEKAKEGNTPNIRRIAEIVRKFGIPGHIDAVTSSVEEWLK